MKVVITDDESPARSRLKTLLAELEGYEVVGEAPNGEQALYLCESLNPDILLLDIRMPGMDGLECAQHLSRLRNPPAIIFLTAYDQHALKAFEANALDYLLKPIRRERLREALGKVQRLTRAHLSALRDKAAETEQVEDTANQPRTHICVRTRGELKLVPVEDVIYFQADQKYVTVRYSGGELLIEESLKSLEKEFGPRFVRIHRNALVARPRLMGIKRTPEGRHLAQLRDVDDELEISRRHVPQVRRRLKEN